MGYCAATAADCPFVAKKTQLSKMAAPKQCDGTPCPGGCCPNVGWYCCPDGMYCAATAADCHLLQRRPSSQRWLPLSSVMEPLALQAAAPMLAATAADCPFVAKKTQLTKMAAPKQCDGTPCPGGCCPNVGWSCCPDGRYCAATAADCPFVAKKTQLSKMAANKQCDGTECPGG